ncbi:uncharacterized protein BYT42DRAFT_572531 [Radiomyces spectabilis]|uniref:uncharacterized protein n=1 Tax=Radiomyces spectabilis TaxID=64574 RepID=UPI002220092D|nr:uncharacterized protein BYT42DRAFT_572531 [Radiomyces spectabilis]KAI8378045.1 hypothetical protein BYT42DRAFT_572531 [Radiomyces spectabilis]
MKHTMSLLRLPRLHTTGRIMTLHLIHMLLLLLLFRHIQLFHRSHFRLFPLYLHPIPPLRRLGVRIRFSSPFKRHHTLFHLIYTFNIIR